MSKRDIKAELNNNSIIGGFIAPQESHTEPKPIKETNSTTDKKELSEGVKKAIIKGVDIAVNGYKYKNGKDKAIKAIVGFVMKNSRGKADASLAEEKIKEIIGN